jgi:universal stress protein E
MSPFKTLLVVYDPTREEQPALERAANIAETIQASAHLFACIHYDTAKSADQSGEIQHLITEQQAVLDDAAASLKERGIDVITEVEWDKDWYHAVVRAALRHDADMVLKSSFRHFAGKRTLKKTSDWIVMRECHCPVLLVKIREPRERRKVLAAIDISATQESYERLNEKILQISNRILDCSGAEVHFVNAFQNFKAVPDKQQLIQDWGIDADKVHIKLGKPEKIILERARELDVNLVVVGNSGRTGLLAAIVGNTAEKVLDKLECDVLSIP